MNNSEFDIIKQFFTFPDSRDDVLIRSGDDCASVNVPENKQLLITTDTLISGVHFPLNTSARDIAYKAVMVNLSDLAAMGARPAWMTLAITLPEIEQRWLHEFSASLTEVLQRYNIALIGGDTTRGVLSITIQAMGLCDKGKTLTRDAAQPGDKIYVTGYPGDAAIGLHAVLNSLDDEQLAPCVNRLNRPEARVEFAEQLLVCSSCAIDISDGLIADLGHIIEASNCGAKINLPAVPISETAIYFFNQYHQGHVDWSMLLTQGDDYELCFTVNEKHGSEIEKLAEMHHLKVSCIGEITATKDLVCVDENNKTVTFTGSGFSHF